MKVRYKIYEINGKKVLAYLIPEIVEKQWGSAKLMKGAFKNMKNISMHVTLNVHGDLCLSNVPEKCKEMTILDFISKERICAFKNLDWSKYFSSKPKILSIFDEDTLDVTYPSPVGANSPKDEETALAYHLNYYLESLGLKQVGSCSSYRLLAYYGDSVASMSLASRYGYLSYSKLLSNVNMSYSLAKLGFIEFLSIDSHLAGSFYESILACAEMQKNYEVKNTLITALIGERSSGGLSVKFRK